MAQKVLDGKTKAYRNHPQLDRFKELKKPVSGLATYLQWVSREADVRGYKFNRDKILIGRINKKLPVSEGQLFYEWTHLKKKLWSRDSRLYLKLKSIDLPNVHPMFFVVKGDIASWEVL